MQPNNNTSLTSTTWQTEERPYSLEWVIAKVDYWLARVSFGVLGGQGQQRQLGDASPTNALEVRDVKPAKNKPYSPEYFNAAQASLDAIFPTAGQGNDWSQLASPNTSSSYNKVTTPSLTSGKNQQKESPAINTQALQQQARPSAPRQNKAASSLTAEQLLTLLNDEPSEFAYLPEEEASCCEDNANAQELNGLNVLSQNNRTVSHSINQLVEHYFATQGSEA
jgi:hypothetical protein